MVKSNLASFTVRIRFRIPAGHRIGVEETRVAFTPTDGREVILMSEEQGKTIRESDWLILESSGWVSKEAAHSQSEPLMDALRRAFVRHHMAVDLGYRACQAGGFTPETLKEMEKTGGRPILNDVHGPMVYAAEPRPLFGGSEGHGAWPPVRDEIWRETFLFALECRAPLSERERTAFNLLSAARRVRDSKDAHFLLLFAAIEALLENSPRPKAVLDHIDRLITLTEETELEKSERESLTGTLKWMRFHSIRSSGRKLVREYLKGREYQGRSAEELFIDCYDLRSRLVHGVQPYPSPEEVTGLVGALDTMVCDLLKGPLLNFEIANSDQGPLL